MLRPEFEQLKIGDKIWIGGHTKRHGEQVTIIELCEYGGGVGVQFEDGYKWSISTKYISSKPPEKKVEISEKNLNDILYHLNSFMGLMRFGGEYDKIVQLLKDLPLAGKDLSELYYVDRIVNPQKRR